VLVDQRGTGQSHPFQCPHDATPPHFLVEMYPVDYVKNCRQVLQQKADLTQYTTPIAVEDLDEVRAWLGYDRINLFGLSYGTRAALVYMRQHPEHVRSAGGWLLWVSESILAETSDLKKIAKTTRAGV
jgi:pimeloyl-ACP methyl ester carboxylesterase